MATLLVEPGSETLAPRRPTADRTSGPALPDVVPIGDTLTSPVVEAIGGPLRPYDETRSTRVLIVIQSARRARAST